jgi:hypothetical protein
MSLQRSVLSLHFGDLRVMLLPRCRQKMARIHTYSNYFRYIGATGVVGDGSKSALKDRRKV